VEFIGGIDTQTGLSRLRAIGTEIHHIGHEGSPLEGELLAAVLPDGKRHVRGTFDATPPTPDQEHAAHCAWHTNKVIEAHTFNSGRGLFQFWAGDGPVGVILEPGDLLVNRGAEHRFLPLENQQLRLRHSGDVDEDFGYSDTGRSPMPWPDLA